MYYQPDGSDAYNAAMSFGYASVAMGILTQFLEKHFKVKKRDFRTFVDFDATEQTIYLFAKLSIRIWQIFAIGINGGLKFLRKYSENKRKALVNNGKETD